LVVCLGEGTKLSSVLVADDKAYEGELELGVETDTLDAEGSIVRERRAEAGRVGRDEIARQMTRMVGFSEQVPPMYSSVKVDGRRLHQLARAGEEVARAARPIEVERFELAELVTHGTTIDPARKRAGGPGDGVSRSGGDGSVGALPRARFRVVCSKGTYVRSLVADLGEALGCGAHLTQLRRTRSGRFGLERALPLVDLSPEAARARLVPLAEAAAHLPILALPESLVAAARMGKPLKWKDVSNGAEPPLAGPLAVVAPDRSLLALADVERGLVRYRRVFTPQG
jgi:tRNA pseudouridine55 synthase